MWIFSKDGFFSTVEDKNDNRKVVVRARTQDDIERIAAKLKAKWIRSDVMADYEYRLWCSKVAFSEYVRDAALEIDYDNFKDALSKSKRFDVNRLQQLSSVRSAMRRSPFDDYDFRAPTPKDEYSDFVKDKIEELKKSRGTKEL